MSRTSRALAAARGRPNGIRQGLGSIPSYTTVRCRSCRSREKRIGRFTQRRWPTCVIRCSRRRIAARARTGAAPVPERVGEPSVFQHVIYIIKENRTYDQVFGDVKEGNGDPDLVRFRRAGDAEPAQARARFCCWTTLIAAAFLAPTAINWADSAHGHGLCGARIRRLAAQLSLAAVARRADALAYSPAGFIWDDALAHGKTFCDFGEFTTPPSLERSGAQGQAGFPRLLTAISSAARTTFIPASRTLNRCGRIVTNTVGWDLDVPDVFRAAQFIKN